MEFKSEQLYNIIIYNIECKPVYRLNRIIVGNRIIRINIQCLKLFGEAFIYKNK